MSFYGLKKYLQVTTPLAVAPVTALKNMPHAVSMLGAAPPGNGGVGMET